MLMDHNLALPEDEEEGAEGYHTHGIISFFQGRESQDLD